MRLRTVLPGLLLLLACNKGSAAKLEGRWRGVKALGVSGGQLTTANLVAAKLELEFHGDQVSVHNGDDKQTTKFRVTADDQGTVVLVTDLDGPAAPQTFRFNEDRLEWAVGEGRFIQFGRE